MTFKDCFSKQASTYSKYRPQYPAELFQFLASLPPSRELAWDVATGNGQAARSLATHYDRVFATDASPAQIGNAFSHPKIKYAVELAERTSLQSESVDLVTVAAGIHWFKFDDFYREVSRVLKPGGVIAAWVYNDSENSRTSEVEGIIRRYIDEYVGQYFVGEVKTWAWTNYETIPFPFVPLAHPDFHVSVEWTQDDLKGYLASWSATQKYLDAHQRNPLDFIENDLREAFGKIGGKHPRRLKLHMRLGRKPG